MKTTKLHFVLQNIKNLRGEYANLSELMFDQIRDEQLNEAKQTLEKLEKIKSSIDYMEQLEVIMPPSPFLFIKTKEN